MTCKSIVCVVVILVAAPAMAQEPTVVEAAEAPQGMDKQELGPRLGLQLGLGPAAAGGMRVGGAYLYRMAESWWFEGQLSTAFGSSEEACGPSGCSHGVVDGFGLRLAAGVRYVFPAAPSGFQPYLGAAPTLGYQHFAGDDLSAWVVGGQASGGLRIKVSDAVALTGEAQLDLGVGFYDKDEGRKAVVALSVLFGVDFALGH
jgi:hypothetical protein